MAFQAGLLTFWMGRSRSLVGFQAGQGLGFGENILWARLTGPELLGLLNGTTLCALPRPGSALGTVPSSRSLRDHPQPLAAVSLSLPLPAAGTQVFMSQQPLAKLFLL